MNVNKKKKNTYVWDKPQSLLLRPSCICLTQSQVGKKCFQAVTRVKGSLLECGKNLILIANAFIYKHIQ